MALDSMLIVWSGNFRIQFTWKPCTDFIILMFSAGYFYIKYTLTLCIALHKNEWIM